MDDADDHLGRIVAAWTEMLRRGSTDSLASLLSPGVVWQGVLPDHPRPLTLRNLVGLTLVAGR